MRTDKDELDIGAEFERRRDFLQDLAFELRDESDRVGPAQFSIREFTKRQKAGGASL